MNRTEQSPRVAVVHDYLREYGGAERVLEALHALYPDAPVYTAFTDPGAMGSQWERFAEWDIRTTWLQHIPFIKQLFSPLRFLAPRAFADLDMRGYDVVISSSNAYYAKAVTAPDGVHLCYCHTPPRSLYGYSTMTDWKKNPLIRVGGMILNHFLRVVDVNIAQEVDHFIANSAVTQQRIRKFYRRDATIIHPPVQIPATAPATDRTRDYFLYVNRLAFAKHPELAVQLCTEQALPLKVVGTGPMLGELQDMAGETVEFLGSVDDDTLHALYGGAKALLYPVEDEDFGMVPVEAMGQGTPVIAHHSGGPMETILDGETGVFFEALTLEGVKAGLASWRQQTWDSTTIYKQAQQYSVAAFHEEMYRVVFDHTD